MPLMCINVRLYLHQYILSAEKWNPFRVIRGQVCREIDDFIIAVSHALPQCKNVELGGRDGLKTFHHGVCAYFIPKTTRINGGWWISIARHLRIFFCFTTLISDATKVVFAEAFLMLIKIYHMTRKMLIMNYKQDHEEFLEMLIHICAPSTKTRCKSIKFHQPTQWYQNRIEMGCAAMEKSLEKMLGESKKKTFKFYKLTLRYWGTFNAHYGMKNYMAICHKSTFNVH